MPVEIAPAELARLVDFSERPRVDDWSLRAALVRYAQPEPQRVNDILDLVRRTEWALDKQASYLGENGDAIWRALSGGGGDGDSDAKVVALLEVARELDQLGEVLATWAASNRSAPSPDAEVDRVVADVSDRLDALGIPQQERPPGPRNRG